MVVELDELLFLFENQLLQQETQLRLRGVRQFSIADAGANPLDLLALFCLLADKDAVANVDYRTRYRRHLENLELVNTEAIDYGLTAKLPAVIRAAFRQDIQNARILFHRYASVFS